MITDKDLLGYLENLLKLELQAECTYRELANRINDNKLKTALHSLAVHEAGHAREVLNLMHVINGSG